MNEQIKELAKQSGFQISQVFGPMAGPYPIKESLEKFAELIVRECAMILDEDDGATHHRELLFTHFGVES